jgi:eukaryotic-like serine/threonine-protein kinase
MATNIPKKLGKYDVLDVVGRGGMGIVYKATDPGIGRVVAIKMVTAGFSNDPELLKRFYREAQSAGKLQHPNIVTIFDLGDHDGNPYMVMEYLEGESLESIIASRRSVPLEQKLNTIIQLCNALSYAHQHNVIHRDIKPANVMVLKDLTVKIVDFGIARIGNENVTRPGQLMGSIPYMSPEQVKDKAYVDSRTDIFSVGVVLYQLLTYALPFDGKDMGAILLKIVHDPPPPLQTYLSAYPEELDYIIAHALAKNSEERYPTADRLAIDLMRVQDELKRDTVSEYLLAVDNLIADSQWNQAKERILQILRIDWQNSRANELLRKVEQQIQTQKRSEQARELRGQAEQAIGRNELEDALRYLDHAVELDSSSHDLLQLRNSVVERKARGDQLAALLHRTESALDAGELEEARKAVGEALLLDPDNREAQALNAIITREIAEQNKLKMVQGFLDEARNRIASRSFTAALDVLKKAAVLAPNVPGIRELANLAASGQEQERRRKQLEGFYTEIEDALNRDNFVLACARADEGLQLFPDDRGLLKFKKLAEKQLQASEKRTYVEGQIAASRQLLDSANPDQSLVPLQEALERYPQEPMLVSMLSVVKETLARRREEQRKADCLQRAKDAIRRKAYTEAIATLEATRKEISSSDLDDLLQFAQEEAANYAARQKIDAAAEQARQFIGVDEYRSAIELLEATLGEVADEELSIILEDARRRLQEFNQRVQESISTAQRLLRNDRCSEAVRFLEAQPEQYGKSSEFAAFLEQARHDLKRIQSFSIARENAREALSHDDFLGAAASLQEFRDEFGDTPDAKLLQNEIEATRSRAATVAMEKALPDVRMLLMVRSFDSAEGILDSLSQWSAYAAPAVKEQYESFCAFVLNAKGRQAANERAEKLKQAQMSDQATSLPEDSQEGVDAGDEIGPTAAMSRSQLKVVLGQVAQIGDHYQDNDKVQTALQDFKRRLTLKIETLEEEILSSITQVPDREIVGAPPPSNPQAPVAPANPVEPQSELTLTEQYAASTPRAADVIPEHPAGIKADEASIESEQATRRQKEAVRNAVQHAQDLLNRGQAILATQILRQVAAQYPGQSEIDDLLTLAESRVLEQRILEIEHQADAQAREGHFEQALFTLEEALKQFPDAEPLRKAWESVLAARERAQRVAVQNAVQHAQDLLNRGQAILAIQILRQVAAQYSGQSEINDLLAIAESRAREQRINEIERQADAQAKEGRFEQALRTLEEGLKQFPDAEPLLKARESALTARERAQRVAEAQRLRGGGEFGRALELVEAGLQSSPGDRELELLKVQIESDQAKQQRKEAIAAATEEAQQHLRDGQIALAIEVLQRTATRFPDDEAVSKLLRVAEERLRKETEWNSIRVRAEALLREGQEEEAVVLLENRVPKEPAFRELLATARSALNAKRREGLLSQAVVLQQQARYGEAQGLVQQAIRQYGSNPAAADLERTLQDQIEIERRRQARDADRDKLLAIEQQVPTTKQSKLKKLAVGAQQIAAPYTADDEVAAIALRIRQRIESQLSATAPPKPIPVRQIAAGAAAILVVLVGIVAVPRLFRVTTVPVEIRTDPPGASVSIGDKSCVTPNCRLELAPGQYRIEAQLTGYEQAERSLKVDSNKQTEPINLTMQRRPPKPSPAVSVLNDALNSAAPAPPSPSGLKPAPMGTLVVQAGVPDALVSVDRTLRGHTDGRGSLSLPLEAKSYQVRVEKPGYQTPREQQVDIASGASQRLTFSLDPLPGEALCNDGSYWTGSKSGACAGHKGVKTWYATTIATPAPAAATPAGPAAPSPKTMAATPTSTTPAPAETRAGPTPPAPGPTVTLNTEAQDWSRVSAASDPAQIEDYLKRYPSGAHKAEAESRLPDLVWGQINQSDMGALQGYLNRFPKSPHARDAAREMDDILWTKLDKSNSQSLRDFVAGNPNSTHRNEAISILDLREADTKGIQAALDKFNAAFQNQKARELKEIWPSAEEKYLSALPGRAGYKLVFTLRPTGEPQIHGDKAVIQCEVSSMTTKPGEQPTTTKNTFNVQLYKKGSWLISQVFRQ